MSLRSRCFGATLAITLLAGSGLTALGATNWPMAGGGPEGRLASASFPGLKLKVSWSSATEFVADPFQCVAAADGRVFAIGKTASSLPNQRLFAFSADTGELLWQSADIAAIPGGVAVDGGRMCPAILGDRVFAGGKGVVQAFAADTGALLWSQTSFPTPFLGIGAPTPSFDVMRPLIARDGTVYAASQYYTVALRSTDGAVLWGQDDRAKMAPRASSSQLIQIWDASGILARDRVLGSADWQLPVPWAANYWYSNVALYGDTTYVLKASNAAPPATTVEAIGPDGIALWTAAQSGYRQPRGLAVGDDRVYVAYICMDTYCSLFPSRVVAFNRTTGAEVWASNASFENPNVLYGDTPLVEVHGSVVRVGEKFLRADTGADVGVSRGWPTSQGYSDDSRLLAFGDGEVFGFVRSGSAMRVAHWVTDNSPDSVEQPGSGAPGGGGGAAGPGSQECRVPPSGPVGVSINDGARFTNSPRVTISPVWPSCTQSLLLSNDGGFRTARSTAVEPEIPWNLDSSGPERLPKTVYLRFDGGGPNYTDDIILDETAPILSAAEATAGSGATEMTRGRLVRLKLTARDKTSGLALMQIGQTKSKAGKPSRYRASSAIRVGGRRLVVRVRDGAGNWSRWRNVQVG